MLDELHAHKVRVLSSQWDSYVRAVGLVRTFASDIPAPASKPDFEAIANTQIANLKKRLRVVERDILPVTEQQLREAVRRGMRRLPPCTERGEEIRDAILWLQVLQLAQDHADTTIAFISANSRQFAEKDGALLPVLAREVLKGRVAYYTSLDAFAKQHATAIEFITAEWIEERIAADAVCSAAEDRMIDLARASVSWSRYGDYPDIGTYWVEFDDFYVYEMEDGTLRVLVIWYGRVEVIVEARPDYDYDINPITGRYEYHYATPHSRYQSKEVEVVVTTEALVRDRQLQSWEVIDVERA